jgi:hypothetical protein
MGDTPEEAGIPNTTQKDDKNQGASGSTGQPGQSVEEMDCNDYLNGV